VRVKASLAFGQYVKQLRKSRNLTQEVLAELTACAPETIRKIEAGYLRPSRQLAQSLAEHLLIPPEEQAAFVDFARSGANMRSDRLAHKAVQPQPAPPLDQALADIHSGSEQPATNLPVQLTHFIGREKEISAVRALLWRNDVRLLTLIGPPGIGKTRLSQEVAASLAPEFTHGVCFVALSPISDPSLVIPTIAYALGVRETGGRSILESVKTHLQDKHVLILLDNFEQVIQAASTVSEVLSAPRIKMLVTSRVRMHVYGEREFPVPPLSLPTAGEPLRVEHLVRCEAIRLFIDRAQAVKPDFALTDSNAQSVAEICSELDGLPLGIELVAPRIRVLPLQTIASKLGNRLGLLTGGPDDLPIRQQTLRGAVDWSYNLLTEGEQRFFRRLSVFVGGCSLEALGAVCEEDLDLDLLEGVESLVSKSLLHQYLEPDNDEEEARFRMLETIREYARWRLDENAEGDELRHRHALYFLRLADEAYPKLRGNEQPMWLVRLEREHDNLRAALSWCLSAPGFTDLGLQLAGKLSLFWEIRSHLSEGQQWMQQALEAAQDAPAALRAVAFNGAGNLAFHQGQYEQATRYHESALELRQLLDDRAGMAASRGNLGNMAYMQGDLACAKASYAEVLAGFRELDDKWAVANTLHNLGNVARAQADYEEAVQFYESSLAMRLELGDRRGIAATLNNLGDVATSQARYPDAFALYKKSLLIRHELGIGEGIATSLESFAQLANACGHLARAARQFGVAQSLRESIGVSLAPPDHRWHEQSVQEVRDGLGEPVYYAAYSEGRLLTIDEAVSYALSETFERSVCGSVEP